MMPSLVDLPSRRSFLSAAAVVPLILTGISSQAQAQHQPQGFWDQPRSIWMKRQATGEEIKAVYWADGNLIQNEYNRICWFMRDLRMEKRIKQYKAQGRPVHSDLYAAIAVSPVLLDILYATGGWLDYYRMSRALLLNSGFRHPITNALTEGAAKNSQHTHGGAGDIVIPGVNSANVSSYGLWLSGGGVGWYPGKSFTHVDSGRLRYWRG